jgi:hypothetical protein
MARCCSQLHRTARLRSSSPRHVLALNLDLELASLPRSLLNLHPHTVDLSTYVLSNSHIAALASMSSICELTLSVDRGDSNVKNAPIDYAPLTQLRLLTRLKLIVGLWSDAAPLLSVLSSQLTTLHIDNNLVEYRICDMSSLLHCTRLTNLTVHDLVVFTSPLRTFQLLPQYAPRLSDMTLYWGTVSALEIDLNFLTAFTCLDPLALGTGSRAVRLPLPILPFLRSLDISRARIPLTAFAITDIAVGVATTTTAVGVTATTADIPSKGTDSPAVSGAWTSLTRLVPRGPFEVRDLRHLPRSLVELDLRRASAIHDTFVDLLLRVPPSPLTHNLFTPWHETSNSAAKLSPHRVAHRHRSPRQSERSPPRRKSCYHHTRATPLSRRGECVTG